jgi:hypothetical protein
MLMRPGWMLRVESACLLVFALWVYAHLGYSWWKFAVLFLAPDLFMLGFLLNKNIGTALYNLAHWLVWPVALFAGGFIESRSLWIMLALIWISHIELDRMLGYGMKYPTGFKDTHLQAIEAGRS